MTGIDSEAEGMCLLGGAGIDGERLVSGRAAALDRARERFRIQLHPVRTDLRRPSDWRFLRVDEQADADSRLAQLPDDAAHEFGRRVRGPACLTRDLPGPNGNERALRRPDG